jgi:hypothetical protein
MDSLEERVYELFFILLEESETSDDNQVDDGQGSKLLALIDKPRD